MIHDQMIRAVAAALGGGFMAGSYPLYADVHPAWGVALACVTAVVVLWLTPDASEVAMDYIIEEDLVVLDPDDVDPEEGSA